jgi:hypothetical protein
MQGSGMHSHSSPNTGSNENFSLGKGSPCDGLKLENFDNLPSNVDEFETDRKQIQIPGSNYAREQSNLRNSKVGSIQGNIGDRR